MSREFLVMKVCCAVCGSALCVEYAKPGSAPHSNGQPTGSEMVELAALVEPCGKCLQPLEDVRKAVSVLLAAAQEGKE